MENKNVNTQNTMGTIDAAITLPVITAKTTLGELLSVLDLTAGQKKPEKTPTPKKFRINFEPVAKMNDCVLYGNGYAYYKNGYRHSVLWLPYCVSYTYHFNPLKDSEKNYLREKSDLPEGMLEATAWPVVATMIAEHRIEYNMDTNAGMGHADIPDYADDENEDSMDNYEGKDNRCMEFMWHEEPINVNPLDALIRKETREAILAELTERQKEIFILLYKTEYTQREVAQILGISQQSVCNTMRQAMKKIKKYI